MGENRSIKSAILDRINRLEVSKTYRSDSLQHWTEISCDVENLFDSGPQTHNLHLQKLKKEKDRRGNLQTGGNQILGLNSYNHTTVLRRENIIYLSVGRI